MRTLSGERLRITAHLIDGKSSTQVWADRFDGAASDVFDLLDLLTARIVGIIEPTIRGAEIARG